MLYESFFCHVANALHLPGMGRWRFPLTPMHNTGECSILVHQNKQILSVVRVALSPVNLIPIINSHHLAVFTYCFPIASDHSVTMKLLLLRPFYSSLHNNYYVTISMPSTKRFSSFLLEIYILKL